MIEKIKKRDVFTLSKAISIVENRQKGYLDLMHEVHQATLNNNTPIIGITGAPGSGKSTCINALIKEFLKHKKRVGVVAVDPSSSFTGGALLGDRVRMDEWSPDQVFFRSIASRGNLGGLSRPVVDITALYKIFGFDIILLESVGVGQNEIEIKDVADHVFLIIVEGLGDEIQFLKAGIMEIAEYFVVNKVDTNPPGRTVRQLFQSQYLKSENNLFQVDSLSGKNITDLASLMMKLDKKIDGMNKKECHFVKNLVLESFKDSLEGKEAVLHLQKLLLKNDSPYFIVKNFNEKFKMFWED